MKAWVFLVGLSLFFGASQVLVAQESAAGALSSIAERRAAVLNELETELRPNLPPQDVQRLDRQVRRLGSFRAEWVREAQDFLVQNATLSELFIYNYSRVQNKRLNSRLIETLARFENFRNPEGILLFAENLMENERGPRAVIPLLQRALEQRSELWRTLSPLLWGEWSERFPTEDKLALAHTACQSSALFDYDTRLELERLAQQSRSLWGRILSADLKECLQRIT